jgi:hypothetical protein
VKTAGRAALRLPSSRSETTSIIGAAAKLSSHGGPGFSCLSLRTFLVSPCSFRCPFPFYLLTLQGLRTIIRRSTTLDSHLIQLTWPSDNDKLHKSSQVLRFRAAYHISEHKCTRS